MGYIGTMENEMETTELFWVYIGFIGEIIGSYLDNGKENGSCYIGVVLG